MLHLNNEILPPIRFERRNLAKVFLKQLKNLGHGGERTIHLSDNMGQIRCARYSDNVLYGVSMTLWDIVRFTGANQKGLDIEQKLPVRIRAARAVVESDYAEDGQEQLVIQLYDAEISIPDDVIPGGSGNSFFLQDFGMGRHRLPISLSDVNPRTRDKRTTVLRQELAEKRKMLVRVEAEWKDELDLNRRKELESRMFVLTDDVVDIRAEIARRRAFAFSSFTFLWVGIPLTLWLNSKNRLVPFFLGNVMAVGGFYPLAVLGIMLGEMGYLPELLVQTGNILLLILGGIFLWRLSKT
jgi:hypothetical protein